MSLLYWRGTQRVFGVFCRCLMVGLHLVHLTALFGCGSSAQESVSSRLLGTTTA